MSPKKLINILMVALAVGANGLSVAESADTVTLLLERTRHDAFFAVAAEGEKQVAVGQFGALALSDDRGNSWQVRQAPGIKSALLGVAMVNGRCIATGQSGLILQSADCIRWAVAKSDTNARLLGVSLNDKGVAYAVGAFGTLLRSSDYGQSWQSVHIEWEKFLPGKGEPHLYSVFVNKDGDAYLVGEFELILLIPREGKPVLLHSGSKSLFDLAMKQDGTAYAVGQEGLILYSPNGRIWQKQESGTANVLTSVSQGDGDKAVVAGLNVLLVAKRGHWVKETSSLAASRWFTASLFSGGSQGTERFTLVGPAGSIYSLKY